MGYHGSGAGNGGASGTAGGLDPDEQEAILAVIRRAEQLEIKEQERVGRLVDRLENMRRNALGKHNSQCLLCGDNFGLLGAQSVLCMSCRKLVCQKCAIEAYSIKNQNKDQWLCKICAETREMWKKSGAWFFKGLPKYILPAEQADRLRNNPPKPKNDEGSSSEDERKPIMRKIETSNKEEIIVHQEATSPHPDYSRQTSSSESQKSSITPYTSEPMEKWDEEWHPGEISRRDSIASRSLSDWNWSDEKTSPSGSIISSNIGYKTTQEDKIVDPSTGTIELSLCYFPLTSILHCTVHRAKNLQPMDINGLADPFCKLDIVPEDKMSRRLRTRTVHKTRNPEFNENLTFYEITENDLMKKSLHILVLDDDKYGTDYMGEAKLNLANLKIRRNITMTIALEKQIVKDSAGPDADLWFDDRWSRGQILISLCYNTKRRALLVTVVKCANLLPMDNNGYSDPFVKLHLHPDPHHRKHKTTIKWKNLNPNFNEEFPFETRPNELSSQSLYITVWDKDYGKSNDYLGGLIIGGIGSKGRRLKHWLEMIKYPDHRHEYWHNLTEDLLSD